MEETRAVPKVQPTEPYSADCLVGTTVHPLVPYLELLTAVPRVSLRVPWLVVNSGS